MVDGDSSESKSGQVESRWDRAILDSERMVKLARDRIRDLKRGIRAFKEMRDTGEPFPGSK